MGYLIISIVLFLVVAFLVTADVYQMRKHNAALEQRDKELAEFEQILKARHRGLERIANELDIKERELEEKENELRKKSKKK